MKYIGAHVGSEPSVAVAPVEASVIGATAFAFNLVNPQAWSSPAYTAEETALFRDECARLGFTSDRILPHSAFVINLGGPDARKRAMSRRLLIDELRRCEALGLSLLNMHPGSHLGKISEAESLALIADNINAALEQTSGVTVVLENTAGQGSNVGYTFAHLAAGYDLSDEDGYERMWSEFEAAVGLAYLRGMHLNDSVRPCGSRIDRHAPLGEGTIGAGAFSRLMADPRADGIPLILETPDVSRWPDVIASLTDEANKR